MNLRRFGLGMFAAAFLMSAAVLSFAADDPPSRVARLKYLDGQVSVQPGGVDEWVAANINRPLTTADNVWTDRDSRAELHLGTAALRMNSETSVTLTNLTDSTVQVQLHQGTLNLHVADLFRGEIYEVDTPNVAFTVTKSGSYRFDVDANGDTTLVTVWSGKGVATGDGPAIEVRGHQQARFESGKSLAHQVYKAPPFDGFDDWARVRDSREDHLYSVRYVPRSVIGYEDLDEYGYWRSVPGYGWVWAPRAVAVGWAPYSFGHWIWVSPWGWTWVDDAPWGFAPFHYGRWIYTSGYWGWVPGPINVRPCYAPALVAWIGGANWGIGISGGGVGWFPLGYGEPYIPYYRASRNYFQHVNITNTRITNITYITNNYYNNVHVNNIRYINRGVPGAVTAVPHDVLVNSRPVSRTAFHLGDRDLHDAEVINGPRVPPSHRTVLGIHGDGPAAAPPGSILRRAVVEKLPAPRKPERFESRFPNHGDDAGRGRDHHDDQPGRAGGPNGPAHDRDADDIARGHNGRTDDHGKPDFPRPGKNGDNDAARNRDHGDNGRHEGDDNDARGNGHDNDAHANGRDNDARGNGHDNDARGNGHDNDARGNGHDNDARGNGHDNDARSGGHDNDGRSGGFGNDARSGDGDQHHGGRNADNDVSRPGRNANSDDRGSSEGQPNRPGNANAGDDRHLPRSVPRPPRRNNDQDQPASAGDSGRTAPRGPERGPDWKQGDASGDSSHASGGGKPDGQRSNPSVDHPTAPASDGEVASDDAPRGRRNEPRIPRPPQAGGEPSAQPSNDFGNSVANPRNGPNNSNDAANSGRGPRSPQVDRGAADTRAPVDRGRVTDSAPVPQAERSVPRPADTGRPAQPQAQPVTPMREQRSNPAVERSVPRPSQIDRGSSVDRAPRVDMPSQVQRSVPRPAEGMRMSQPDAQPRSMPDRPASSPVDGGMSRGPQMDRAPQSAPSMPRMSEPSRSAPSMSVPRSAPESRGASSGGSSSHSSAPRGQSSDKGSGKQPANPQK